MPYIFYYETHVEFKIKESMLNILILAVTSKTVKCQRYLWYL